MNDGGTILVVDDVPQNVRLLEAVLEPSGYEIVTAADGLAALEQVESAHSDLVASRLADEAAAGQVLIDRRLYAEVEADVEVEPVGEFQLKGFRRPVAAFDVLAVRDATPAQDLAHRSGIGPPLPKTNAWRSGRFEISGDG